MRVATKPGKNERLSAMAWNAKSAGEERQTKHDRTSPSAVSTLLRNLISAPCAVQKFGTNTNN